MYDAFRLIMDVIMCKDQTGKIYKSSVNFIIA